MGSRPFPRWGWTVHGDGKHITPGDVVAPEERLSWGRTIGIGMQHVIAMFGATLLVPTLTGFPVNTTLLFSGVGTIVFLLITRNRLPSYLGSSFAFIAPLTATQGEGIAVQLGGIVVVGVVVVALGVVVKTAGPRVLDAVMPPAVTGAIVALIGLNLAPTAATNYAAQPLVATVTMAAILIATVAGRGMVARLGILIGVIVGWLLPRPLAISRRGQVRPLPMQRGLVCQVFTLLSSRCLLRSLLYR